MTTNLVESMNSVFKGVRNLPITALVRATYFRMGTLFETRRSKWSSVLQSGQVYSETCHKFLKEESAKANTHLVTMFDRQKGWFSVQETMDHNEGRPRGYYRVELDRGWCDCGKFQALCMPCSHVLASCAHARSDPSQHISPIYGVNSLLNVYSRSFSVIATEDYWPAYQGEIVWHNEHMRRKKKGRPNSTRIQTEMDTVRRMKRLCGSCRQPGHNRKNCPNVGSSNAP